MISSKFLVNCTHAPRGSGRILPDAVGRMKPERLAGYDRNAWPDPIGTLGRITS